MILRSRDPLVVKFPDGEVLPGDVFQVDADSRKDEMKFDRATAKAARH